VSLGHALERGTADRRAWFGLKASIQMD
jgi:hypothetical protein